MTYQAASERLADLGREFYRRGWALGTSGNFSAVIDREPLHLAITASSVDKGRLTADQILENSQDMEALSAETALLLRENTNLHGFLIRRHGLYTWGKDLAEATRHVEILEFLLESVGRRQMMEPQY